VHLGGALAAVGSVDRFRRPQHVKGRTKGDQQHEDNQQLADGDSLTAI